MSYKQILNAPEKKKQERAEKQKKIILDIKEICNKNGIELYPVSATLLGFVRERKSILYDEDAEFYIDYLDYDKFISLEENLKKKGYKLSGYGPNCKYMVLNLEPFEKCFFHIDVTCFIRDRNKMLALRFVHRRPDFFEKLIVRHKNFGIFLKPFNYLFCYYLTYKVKRYVYPYKWFKNHVDIEVYGTTFKIMEGHEEFLKEKYGVNWRTPDWNRKYVGEKTMFKKHYMLKDLSKFKIWLDRPLPDGFWKDGKIIR